jgi:tRNA-splicing ligase RtcB
VLCADGHYGYSQPVGGAVAYREHISPGGVGYDIGCGNKAVLTDLSTATSRGRAAPHGRDRDARIAFGVGLPNEERATIRCSTRSARRRSASSARCSTWRRSSSARSAAATTTSTCSATRSDRVWVGVHFGSRGFGHKTASRYFGDGPMDAPPELLPIDSERGQEYIAAMELAGRYAYAGRDVVVDKVLEILGAHASTRSTTTTTTPGARSTAASSGGSCARAAPRRSPASRGSSARRWRARR